MKLLFDQNSSHRIIKKLPKAFKDCNQVRNLSLVNASDIEIWNFAKTNNFHVVTFDADFFNIAQLNGHPPKIIWIRSGNLTTNKIVELLTKHKNTMSRIYFKHGVIINTIMVKIINLIFKLIILYLCYKLL